MEEIRHGNEGNLVNRAINKNSCATLMRHCSTRGKGFKGFAPYDLCVVHTLRRCTKISSFPWHSCPTTQKPQRTSDQIWTFRLGSLESDPLPRFLGPCLGGGMAALCHKPFVPTAEEIELRRAQGETRGVAQNEQDPQRKREEPWPEAIDCGHGLNCLPLSTRAQTQTHEMPQTQVGR